MRKFYVFLTLISAFILISSCAYEEKISLASFSDMTSVSEAETVELTTRKIDYNDPDWAEDSWLIDIDADFPSMYIDTTCVETVKTSIRDYFKYLVSDYPDNPAVTDVLLNIYEQSSLVPTDSDAITWMYEKCTWTEENGVAVDYSQFDGLYKVFTEYGIDIFAEMINVLEEMNVRPWIYFRMNDFHYVELDEPAYLRSEFYYEALENDYMLGDKAYNIEYNGNYENRANCLDFAEPRVREVLLEYLEETILKYDVFGIQLDFMRNIDCFDYLSDEGYVEIMNQFIRDSKAIVEKAEEKFGHPIKFMIRCGRSVEHNKVFGFDAETWIKEGLVDAIVVSPLVWATDNLPISEWRELAGDNVAILACIEDNLINYNNKKTTENYVKGFSAGYYAQGADGMYFNNFFQKGSIGPSIWKYGIDKDSLYNGVRKVALSYQDKVPINHFNERYEPIPSTLESEGSDYILSIGEIIESDNVYLIAGFSEGCAKIPDVSINGFNALSKQIVDYEDVSHGDSVPGSPQKATSVQLGDLIFVLYEFASFEGSDDVEVHFENSNDILCYLELVVES